MKHYKQFGFTIVELAVVIAVVGILAMLTIVSYTSVQKDGRDTIRKSDLVTMQKAILLYYKDKGDYVQAGCGSGAGSGWVGHDYDGTGANRSIMQCLTDDGYLTSPLKDPSNDITCGGLSCHAYMKASCTAGHFLYANIEALPHTPTDTDGTCQSSWDESYGMNYYVEVKL